MEQENTQKQKGNPLNNIMLLTLFSFIVIGGFTVGAKLSLLATGLFSLLMYTHITITTLANAFVGRNIDPNYDVFWKFLFIVIGTICTTLYFTV